MLISTKSVNTLAEKLSSSTEIFCSGLFLSARWFVISQLDHDGIQLVVLPDKESAEYCAADLYTLIEGDKVFFLPDSGKNLERSNYKSTLGVQRTSAVGKILDHKEGQLIVVTYPSALEEGIPDAGKIKESLLKLSVGDEISHDDIVKSLFDSGFERVDFVGEPGQFAIRGAIVDIFSYSYNDPFRVSFFGDEIDTINIFDCNTQLSKEKVQTAEIYPDIVASEEEGECMMQIADMLPADTLIWLDSSDMYRNKGFFPAMERFRKIYMELPLSRQNEDAIKFNIAPQPVFNKNFELLTEDIRKRLEEGYRVRIYGEKQSQLERLQSILSQNGGIMPEFIPKKNIHNGFIDHENKVCCYSDHEIFDRFHRVSIRRTVEKSEQLTINDLTSFAIGDYIVHIDYGVGIFGGLVRMKDDKGRMHEVVKLMYRDNDVVFVSVHALHKISRYKSKDSEPPKIHKLGSKVWQNLKASTKSKVKDIAKDLIQLYAKRKSARGFAFSADTFMQQELESSFMYEDTPDQEKAVQAVKRDMEDDCPMDRLVCGDVGFGKTEVAVRAAFKAVADSKQVAVLVPTTILALQHFNTFRNRLKDFPCNIDYVSRLRTAKEISDIQKRLKAGTLDIVIGTHKLIGKGFEFKDLGLLIIDEEQKFGVSAKEKLRQLKASVDTLTLTATPIPRTLQFSLLGARDLSIISTPPPNRIPVQTEIMLFDHDEIKKIIRYELNRGGQIFFLHNRVEELQSIEDILHRLVPDMKICVAHGQMEAKVLENKTLFYKNGFYPYKFFDYAREQIKGFSFSTETAFLYLYIALAKDSFDFFVSHGFDEDLFFDTFESISRSCICYRRDFGTDGIYDYLWLSGHLCANVIRLGSFEYQNGVFGFDKSVCVAEKTINKGNMAVFLHVPFNTDFSFEARHNSYKKAYSIFGENFLVCDSWLLYPANAQSLADNSNICSFAKDFELFHVDNDFCYEDLYRIFGVNSDLKNIDDLTDNTCLQKLYIERLRKGLPSGSGVGIRLLSEKN